jgi:hypothetical protein
MDTVSDKKEDNKKLLAQNIDDSSLYSSVLDSGIVDANVSDSSTSQESFAQCRKA